MSLLNRHDNDFRFVEAKQFLDYQIWKRKHRSNLTAATSATQILLRADDGVVAGGVIRNRFGVVAKTLVCLGKHLPS